MSSWLGEAKSEESSIDILDQVHLSIANFVIGNRPIVTGCNGSVAEIIAQIQRTTPFVRKAEVTKQRGQLSQCGQERPLAIWLLLGLLLTLLLL